VDGTLLHILLSSALIGLGLYLFGHPKILSSRTRLFRGVVIWAALVIGLKALDYAFLR
jgi:hypothetical protein